MFSLVITEKGGAQRQLDFEGPEITIGRLEDNEICLPKNNVSKQHARLVYKDDRFVLVDQKSTNGTYVNGRRISAPMVVRRGDKIYIGDFILTLVAPEGMGEARVSRAPSPYLEPRKRESDRPQTHSYEAPGLRVSQLRVSQLPVVHVTDLAPRPATHEPATHEPATHDQPMDMHVHEPSHMPPAHKPGSLRPPPVPRETEQPTRPLRSTPPPASVPASVPASQPASLPAEASERPLPPSLLPKPSQPPAAREPGTPSRPRSIPPWSKDDSGSAQGGLTSPAVLAPSVRLQGALVMLMERLGAQLDIKKPAEAAFPSAQGPVLERLMDELASEGAIGADLDRRFLRESAISEAVGLGPLDRLLANRAVREVVIDGPARILADLGGGLSPVSAFFSGEDAVMVVARRLLRRAGRELDEHAPVQEAQLPGGGLVQLLLPPLSPKGPLISVRCPPRGRSSAESMITDGMLSSDMLALLRAAVQKRQNVLVLGPQGAGVSTLLGALSALAPDDERVVFIEDLPSQSLLSAQTLPLARRAAPGLDLAALLKHASRLRYDRLVIDDVVAQDALAALTAAAANSGVLLGMHAPDPGAALTQLELFAQLGLGGAAGQAQGQAARGSLAELLARAVQVVVHIAQGKDGSRRIQSVSEVRGAQGETLEVRGLYRQENGSFRASEHRASFLG